MTPPRDHGGGLDAAVARYGGIRLDWLDLSTGINPVPYPTATLPAEAWTALPDSAAQARLIQAARHYWNVPEGAKILATPGASALIARLPGLLGAPGKVWIPRPTYNEWQAAFDLAGWQTPLNDPECPVGVYVHPNNPDGAFASTEPASDNQFRVFDESFCDATPDMSAVKHTASGQVAVVKSFGKFWGLAGLRLGFLIGPERLIQAMADALGPWPVSGPALAIGAQALSDPAWSAETIARLAEDARRLDRLMAAHGASAGVGTHLFRLYQVPNATAWQDRLARGHVWSRIFPYSKTWLRLGLPAPERWGQLEAAL